MLEGEHRIDGLVIHRDQTEVGEASLSMPLPVDPGKHRVEATAPGRQPWSEEIVVGPESDSATVVIPLLQPLSEATVAAPVVGAPTTSTDLTTSEGHTEQPSELGTQKLVGVAVGGLGVVGVGVGTWMLLDAASLETESEKYCEPPSYTSCSDSGFTYSMTPKVRETWATSWAGWGSQRSLAVPCSTSPLHPRLKPLPPAALASLPSSTNALPVFA